MNIRLIACMDPQRPCIYYENTISQEYVFSTTKKPRVLMSAKKSHTVFLYCVILQARCEAILRTRPESRLAAELHLASIAAEEELERERVKRIATGTGVAVAVGLAAGLASLLLKR